RPHLPYRERQEQRRDRGPEIAPGDGSPGSFPELLVLRSPVPQHRAGQSPYVLRPMDILHLRQFGKLFERFADGATLHLADRYVHPQEPSRDEQKKQHEATSPYPSKIVERAEGDGKNEAAKPADHADETADRADVVRIVDGDVLVDGGLAES